MNNQPEHLNLGALLLDIGGLDKAPVERGLTLRKAKTEGVLVLNVGNSGEFAAIRLNADETQRLREALGASLTLEERAIEAFDALFYIINKMSFGEEAIGKALSEMMRRQHRTLIQQWWGVVAKAIANYSRTMPGSYDLRNEDSVKWAKEVVKVPAAMRFI